MSIYRLQSGEQWREVDSPKSHLTCDHDHSLGLEARSSGSAVEGDIHISNYRKSGGIACRDLSIKSSCEDDKCQLYMEAGDVLRVLVS